MKYSTLILFLLADVVAAFLIAKYQQKNGYKLLNSFIGILIGLIGLTVLGLTVYIELLK